MKNLNLYSKKSLTFLRGIVLVAIIILLISNLNKLIRNDFLNIVHNNLEFHALTVNFVVILLLVIALIYPQKFEICALVALLYTVLILLYEPLNDMGLFMYYLAISFMYARGYFNKHRRIKNIIATVFFLSLVLTEIRFGVQTFCNSLLEKTGITFVFLVILYFLQSYIIDVKNDPEAEQKLDIHNSTNLKRRDAEWLVEVINGSKYEKIAIESSMSLGSVKNRFKYIFEELQVGDKKGFLNKYSEYDIYYGSDLLKGK